MLLLKAIVRYIQDGRGVLRAMRMRHGVYMGARRAARTCRTLLRSSGITGTKDVSPARDFARGKSLSQVRLGFCCTRLHPKTQYLIIYNNLYLPPAECYFIVRRDKHKEVRVGWV